MTYYFKHHNFISLFIILFLIFFIGCGKQEESQSNKKKAIKSAQKELPKTNTTIKVQEQSTDKIDDKKVGSLVSKFSDMLGSLVKFAGSDIYMKTNKINLAEFVKGKTDEELYMFIKNSLYKSPYASKQVCEYLLERIKSDTMYLDVSHNYADLLSLVGDKSDIKRAKSICEKVETVYITSDKYQTSRERENIIIIMNAYGTILFDDKMRKNIVDTIRKYGKTPEEQSAADYYDAMLKIENGTPENLNKARSLLNGIQKRGVYSYYDATHKDVKNWLDNFDVWAAKIKEIRKIIPENLMGRAKNNKNVKKN